MGLLDRLNELDAMRKSGQINDSEYEMLVANAARNTPAEIRLDTRADNEKVSATVTIEASQAPGAAKSLVINELITKLGSTKLFGLVALILVTVILVVVAISSFNRGGNSDLEAESSATQLSTRKSPLDGGIPSSIGDWTDITVKDMNEPFEFSTNRFWAFRVEATYVGADTGVLSLFVKGAVDENGVLHRVAGTAPKYALRDFDRGNGYNPVVISGATVSYFFWFDIDGAVTDLVFKFSDSPGEGWIRPSGSIPVSPPTTLSAEDAIEAAVVELQAIQETFETSKKQFFNLAFPIITSYQRGLYDDQSFAQLRTGLTVLLPELQQFCEKTSKVTAPNIYSVLPAISKLNLACSSFISSLRDISMYTASSVSWKQLINFVEDLREDGYFGQAYKEFDYGF